ncbi:glycosyltransferase family 4 protein [Paraglaciecola arctica]|uniref:glycosyltransferase family 4 protein n=1 Tax=Paraglaciecola arctica TaxID=1128911 RepID=UPI001C06BA65|nr:glycosyltransferase family 4 protein [Paraglaciecola arctica]MBU3003550.1 glycosyltransferase family 4 protein [Paraglaciecola arctica]
MTLNDTHTLLVLGYVWPEPNSSAAGSHMLSLLKMFLEQGYQVTFASPAQQGEHKADLTELGITEQAVAINCSSFDSFIAELNPNIVLFDRFMLEEQFAWRVAKHCPNAIRVLDTEDLHSLRHARHQALKQHTEITNQHLNSDLAKREIAAIFRCDLSLIISDFELALLKNHYAVPEHILWHCPFMVDIENFVESKLSFQDRQHFVSIGNFRHEPNWDAVLFLKQYIWPLIRQQLPKAELHIFGAYPPPKATQLHNSKQGFLVKGWAQDAKQVMQQARVCLAPLRFGAGIKGKLAEAMLCGTPNITTNIGTEGMSMGVEWPGLTSELTYNSSSEITQSDQHLVWAKDLATNAVQIYQDEQLWIQKQKAGYSLIKKHFDKDTIQTRLMQRILDIQQNLHQHRCNNFIGQMLQHHLLKSTQYMAQWIEAKNSR